MNGFSRRPPVRRVAAVVALVAAAGVVGAGPASAAPRTAGAGAFHDSVGLVANDTYFDTPYLHWSTALDKARELGVRHLRLGVFSADDAGWDARHAADLQDAAAAGFGLELIVSRDCASDGTMPRCLARARSLPAGSVEGLEWPHEYDNRGDGNWVAHLSAWGHELAFRARGDARLAGVPIIGPSLRFVGSPLALGDQSAALDRVNLHPYTGGQSPTPGLVRAEVARLRPVTGVKPVVVTDAGFHTALGAPAPVQPAVDERTAAVYTLRTVLEHFTDGVQRTYLRELVDEAKDLNDERVSYGLMRTDFSPKPAYTALQRLLALAAPGSPPVVRELDHAVTGAGADVRELVLDRADGTTLVALWRTASIWDRRAKREIAVKPDTVHVTIPAVRGVTVSDPVTGTGPAPAAITDDTVDLALGADPLVLTVTGGRRLGVVPDTDLPFEDDGTPATGTGEGGTAACYRTVPHITGLRVTRSGGRWVATFRLSKNARVGATIDRQRRIGAARTLRYGRLTALRSRTLRKGSRRIVLARGMAASRYRYRVVLTARDASGSRSGAGVRYWVRAGGRARGLRTEVGPLVATRCKAVPWISRLRVTQHGSRWVATFRLARNAKVGGFMGRQVRVGPVHRLKFRTVKRFRAKAMRRGSRRIVLGTGLQIVKYRYRLVLTAHDASGNKGVAGLRFKYGAGRTTRR